MKTLPIILVSLLISCTLLGQDDLTSINNNLTIQAGVNYLSLIDQTFSPIVIAGTIPNFRIGFNQNKRNKTLWSTDISVAYGNLDYNNEYFSSTYASVQLSFNYLSKIKSFGKSKLYLGGQFSSVLNILDYDGFESGSWYTAQQLEPILIYHYAISEKQAVSGQFSYPIASLVGRPNYAGVDEFVVANSDNIPKILYSRMKIYSLNKLINPNFELKYSYNLRKIVLSISANYSYLQVNSISKYYKNELGLNLQFQLKIGK